MASAGFGLYAPFATTAIRSRLRLSGTTRPRFALLGGQRRNLGTNASMEARHARGVAWSKVRSDRRRRVRKRLALPVTHKDHWT
jgi:hypothetical protein